MADPAAEDRPLTESIISEQKAGHAKRSTNTGAQLLVRIASGRFSFVRERLCNDFQRRSHCNQTNAILLRS